MPISLHALITRSAISPRFAINTLRNIPDQSFLNQTRKRRNSDKNDNY
jgi:hypothetical protein